MSNIKEALNLAIELTNDVLEESKHPFPRALITAGEVNQICGYLLAEIKEAAIKDEDGNIIEPDANGWYPISCAPKDGSAIMVYTHDLMAIEEAAYDDEYAAFKTAVGNEVLRSHYAPTHWRPTFNPPVE